MAKVIEKRPDGTTVVVVPAADAAELEVGASVDVRPVAPTAPATMADGEAQPRPFGALAGKYPPVEIEDIKAARREALLGKSE